MLTQIHKNKTMAEYFDDFIQKELESTINFDEAYDELELLKLKIAEKLDVDSFLVKVQELTTTLKTHKLYRKRKHKS